VIPDCQGRLAAAIKFIHANKKKKTKERKKKHNITSSILDEDRSSCNIYTSK